MRSLIAHRGAGHGLAAFGRRGRHRIASGARTSLVDFFRTTRPDAVPRWVGWAGAATLFSLTGLYGVIAGGQVDQFVGKASAAAGFAISEIKIAGQVQLNEIEVLEALDIHPGSSLLTYDAPQALDRLSRNGWVAGASVRKIYPGTLKIALQERQPLGLWQRGSLVSLIDRTGTVIADTVADRFAALPLFVGHGANVKAEAFLELLDRYPAIRSRVRAAVHISGRRWDLVLDNDIEIKLPETDIESALAELLRLNAEAGLMTRDIVVVDLRRKGEVIVRLSDEAMSSRRTTIKSQRSGGKRETDT